MSESWSPSLMRKNTSVAWIKIDISNILIFSDPHTKRYYEMLQKPFKRRTAAYSEAVNFHFNGLKFNTILFYLPILSFSRTFHTIVSIMFLLYIELQKPPLIFPVMNASFYKKKKTFCLSVREVGCNINYFHCCTYIPGMTVEAGWAIGLSPCCIDSWCSLASCKTESRTVFTKP